MYRSFLSVAFMAAALALSAQLSVHRVWVLNEGRFDYMTQTQEVPVSLGAYDPSTGAYQHVLTLSGPRFGNDLEVKDAVVYVAADDQLLKIDADSHMILAQVTVPGIRRIALWNDQVLLTRGELGGLSHYFEARQQADLALIYELAPGNGPDHASEDVQVVGDEAYIAINNGFDWPNYTGQIGVVDLPTGTYVNEIDLGPNGKNPERIFEANGDLFVFNNKDFSGSSISRLAPAAATLHYTQDIALNSGCGASALVDGRIYYLEYALYQMGRFDISTGQVLDTLSSPLAPYAILQDSHNGVVYMTTTDFATSGELHVTDELGNVLSTVAVGVSPGNMALDLRSSTAVADDAEQKRMALYPNPAVDQVWLSGAEAGAWITVLDATGRRVQAMRTVPQDGPVLIDLAGLAPGSYTVQAGDGRTGRLQVVRP